MALYGALAETVREGKEVIVGDATFGEGGSVDVTHPFAQVLAVIALVKGDAGIWATYEVDGDEVTFHAWTVGEADESPAAVADTSEADFTYLIVGKRRQ